MLDLPDYSVISLNDAIAAEGVDPESVLLDMASNGFDDRLKLLEVFRIP